jgi:VanZ family protein
MSQTLARFAAFAVFAFIAFATLSPIDVRPSTGEVGPERFSAFALFGLLVALSLPRRPWTAAAIAVTIAAVLETLQLVVPTRHAHLADAIMKSMGAIAGVSLAELWQLLRNRVSPRN